MQRCSPGAFHICVCRETPPQLPSIENHLGLNIVPSSCDLRQEFLTCSYGLLRSSFEEILSTTFPWVSLETYFKIGIKCITRFSAKPLISVRVWLFWNKWMRMLFQRKILTKYFCGWYSTVRCLASSSWQWSYWKHNGLSSKPPCNDSPVCQPRHFGRSP